MMMEETECSEMSAYKIQTPENHPKERIQQTTCTAYDQEGRGRRLMPSFTHVTYPVVLLF